MLISLAACAVAALCVLLPSVASARSGIVDVLRRGVTALPRDRRLRRASSQAGRAGIRAAHLGDVPGTRMDDAAAHTRGVRRERRHGAGRVAARGALCQRRTGRQLLRDASALVAAASRRPRRGDRRRAADDRGPRPPGGGRAAWRASRGSGDSLGEPRLFRGDAHPMAAGRIFNVTDTASAPPRVVVSSLIAQRLFGAGRRSDDESGWAPARSRGNRRRGRRGQARRARRPPTPSVYLPSLQVSSPSSLI